MKDLKKLNKLTHNPITLLFGINHKYLKRIFTMWFRIFVTIVSMMFVMIGISVGNYGSIFILVILYGVYYLIDHVRIQGHLNKFNEKFKEALNLIESKEYIKGFKKLILLDLKESTFWIIENNPELLMGSLMENVDKNQFEKITKQIERKDVDGVISSLTNMIFKL